MVKFLTFTCCAALHAVLFTNVICLSNVIPMGVSESRAFFSGRVALRDLLFYGKSFLRLHDGQHFAPCTVYGCDSSFLFASLAAQQQSGRIFHYEIQMLSSGLL